MTRTLLSDSNVAAWAKRPRDMFSGEVATTGVVAVGVGVGVAVAVGVGVAVAVGMGVAVGVGEGVAVGVGEGVAVGMGMGVAVGVSEAIAVGTAVDVSVDTEVAVALRTDAAAESLSLAMPLGSDVVVSPQTTRMVEIAMMETRSGNRPDSAEIDAPIPEFLHDTSCAASSYCKPRRLIILSICETVPAVPVR